MSMQRLRILELNFIGTFETRHGRSLWDETNSVRVRNTLVAREWEREEVVRCCCLVMVMELELDVSFDDIMRAHGLLSGRMGRRN